MPDAGSPSTPALTSEPGTGSDSAPPTATRPTTTGATPADVATDVAAGVPVEVPGVRVDEVRVLEGPNLYFPRPTIKVSLHLHGYLAMRRTEAEALARRLGMRAARPGRRGSALRQRFVMRVIRTVTKRVGSEIGVGRLGVRVRAGQTVDDVVIAFPWVHRTRGQVAGEQIGAMLAGLLDPSRRSDEVIEAAGAVILASPDGPPPSVLTPRVPVASVTGTNGKTTTTRLMAHMCMTAGLRTAWSSTDGVVVMGETKEAGDFSGPAGARGVLETPGLEIGILETARGGMLLKGMGVTANDVSVVTNVSADHLGLQGIDTLDQLAEVKAIVTTVTKPEGWVVLNGDDPRVWAMRHGIKAKPWAFSLDPASPALWESINQGGRGITVLDGEIVVLSQNGDPDRLVKIVDVPMTLSGLSHNNIANALAGAAAALGLGVARSAVIEGLRTFAPDPEHNWGRLNTYSLPLETGGRATIIMDMAHNEAGLEALLEVARGLAAPGGAVRLSLGCAGDRTDEAIIAMGEIAGRGAEEVALKIARHYLRGRDADDLLDLFREGLAKVGVLDVPGYGTELASLEALAPHAHAGDVIALMCHAERAEVDAWIREHGGTVDDARTIRRKVVAARGEHELESEIAALWSMDDAAARVTEAQQLVDDHPGDARLVFELAGARDSAGDEQAAIGLYEQALAAGLKEPHRHRAQLQLASSLRVVGRAAEAAPIVDEVLEARPHNTAAIMFRALVQADLGQERQAVADLIRASLEATTDVDTQSYRRALRAYADELAPPHAD
ncbi:cyanophycin synthetase [Humibacillus xanthopallidus]|uniref:Cyanophycin synthetase n=1 Tax=Humibacillus xanthopallidus TaxID=412689 RepID=A0A543PVC2_9MICO|nr:tetratricopeptide repeat protein [Humibacillus xanthopallidus]TQN48027.1 cyanophycin synthetase [Humibacillus xanthopallidus]